MLGGLTLDDVTVAAAFVLGAVLGALATIRLTRAVAETLRRERRKDRPEP